MKPPLRQMMFHAWFRSLDQDSRVKKSSIDKYLAGIPDHPITVDANNHNICSIYDKELIRL